MLHAGAGPSRPATAGAVIVFACSAQVPGTRLIRSVQGVTGSASERMLMPMLRALAPLSRGWSWPWLSV